MKKRLILIAVSFAVALSACQNNDDLWDAVNDLKSRVQALETQVSALNKNIEALQELAKEGQTITNVDLKDGVYTITLSDGEQITLTQGSDAKATVPIMGIDTEGYWVVDYQDGAGFQQILVGGKPVKAAGTDAPAPKFKIEETTGYWMVSTDGGTQYDYVLNDKGEKVSAFGTGGATDSFFKSVELKDGMLNIEMLTGEKLSIPVVSNFYCRIITDEQGVQVFNADEVRTFRVEIKGVDDTKLTAPQGWRVQLAENGEDEALLTITAPASTITTRGIEADTRTDVVIEAFSNNYACMSKIQVRLSDVVIPKVTAVTEKTNSASSTTLTFTVDVTPAGADWYWVSQSGTAAAPSAAAIVAAGNKRSDTEFTVTNLSVLTTYKVYVVAVASDGTVDKNVVSAQGTTTDTDYYEDGVVIDGVTYSKDSPNATLVSEAKDITEAGVYFIDTDQAVTVKCNSGIALSDLAIIGRKPGAKPTIKVTNIMSMGNAATGSGFVFSNITFDAKAWTNYIFNFDGATSGTPTGTYERFVFEDCVIETAPDKPFSFFNKASAIKKIIIRNNKIHLNVSAAEQAPNFLNIGASALLAGFQSIEISNNVFYANFPSKTAIVMTPNSANKSLSVTIDRNTFVNCLGNPNGYVVVGAIQRVSLDKNIMWSAANANLTSYLARFQSATNNGEGYVTDNKVYGEIKGWGVLSNDNLPSNLTEKPKITPEATDPFAGGTFDLATGTFIPGPGYLGYGADLK